MNFSKGNYNDAIRLFEQVEKDYSYTEWASKALINEIFMYYDTSNYIEMLYKIYKNLKLDMQEIKILLMLNI